jgi:hypothetical protein
MKRLVTAAILLLLLFNISCKRAEEIVEEKTEEVVEVPVEQAAPLTKVEVEIPDYQFSLEEMRINEHMADMDLRAFKHYGEFYTDDFSIFRLDRIDFLAESFEIEDINLFFIDSLLVKIQTFYRGNQSTRFMKRFGKAKIAINDYESKKALETEKLIVKVDGKNRINSKVENYTLNWERNELDIIFYVNKNNISRKGSLSLPMNNRTSGNSRMIFELTVQATNFDDQMAWIKWESYKEGRDLN